MSFTNSQLVELKALNIIKSLVIRSTSNETGLNLGWVFAGFFCRFFRWVYPKNPPEFFWGIYPGFWTLSFMLAPPPLAKPHNQFSASWLKMP